MDEKQVKELISPIDDVATSTPEENLGTALSLINSSNEAVFVIDRENNFLGLISPIYTIYKKRHPYSTKIESVLTHPPFLTEDSKIKDVLEDMFNLRIFQLPVFEKGTKKKKIIGKIEAKDILKAYPNELSNFIDQIKIDEVYTVNERSKVEEVYSKFRSLKVSDVAVIDDLGKLVGLISRKDIQESYIKPSSRQRFNKDADIRADNISFDVEESYRWSNKIRKYESKMVFTLSYELTLDQMINQLINSEFNDAVVIDESSRPIGILTTEGILKGTMNSTNISSFEIKLDRPEDIPQNLVNEAASIIKTFGERMSRRNPLNIIEISFKQPKFASGRTAFYNANVRAQFAHGKTYMAQCKRRGFLVSLRGAISEIKKQIQREKDQLGHHVAVTYP